MSFPQGTEIITDDQAREIIKTAILMFRYPPQSFTADMALDLSGRWSDRHSEKLIQLVWTGLDSGLSLYVHPSFLAQPPVTAEPDQIDGYNQYIKE